MQERATFGRRGLPVEPRPSETWPSRQPSAPVAATRNRPSPTFDTDMNPSDILAVLFSAQGRMSRVHYCIQSLVSSVAFVVIVVTLNLSLPLHVAPLIGGPLSIAFLWSVVAIRIRRWHDRDKSGWWCLLLFLPVVGWVWAAVECRYLSGTRGPNRFGDDPRSKAYLSEVFA